MIRQLMVAVFISLALSLSSFAELIEPSLLRKQETNYGMAFGPYAGHFFWAYLVDDQIKFNVLSDFTSHVDALIDEAINKGRPLHLLDDDVHWFYEQELVDKFLRVGEPTLSND